MDRGRRRRPSLQLRGTAGGRLLIPAGQPPRRPPAGSPAGGVQRPGRTREAPVRERLRAPERRWLDQLATRLAPLPWEQKSDRLAEIALAWGEAGMAPRRLAPATVITAVLERWSYPGVVDPYQACLYLLSSDPRHREMVARYLAAHPEDAALVTAELVGGHPISES
jgi:hypothetical protein